MHTKFNGLDMLHDASACEGAKEVARHVFELCVVDVCIKRSILVISAYIESKSAQIKCVDGLGEAKV